MSQETINKLNNSVGYIIFFIIKIVFGKKLKEL
jgi:hypothetical protein